ncbi:MAG TPA: hypothetical protein VN524_18460 [Hyphomicrobiaceae bacterium]|nr:hypothetical protein [Hyphomicrobiaceae bacterium]
MSAHQAPISHRESATTLWRRPWRVGGSTGRAVYCWPGGDDDVIGLMDTRDLAAGAVAAHNWALCGQTDYAAAAAALGLDAAGAPG